MAGFEATGQLGDVAGERVLVVYDSHDGSTAEIADEVASTLAIAGARVDVRHTAEIADICQYDRIVVGGAIRYDRWMAGASNFVRQNQACLATIPDLAAGHGHPSGGFHVRGASVGPPGAQPHAPD